jgi:addiction module HigA family antidote
MKPKNRAPAHPGEILKRMFLDDLDISQMMLSKHLGWTYAKVNEIVNKKRGITPESATALSKAFDTSPLFWLNLQTNYDLYQVDEKEFSKIKPLKRA